MSIPMTDITRERNLAQIMKLADTPWCKAMGWNKKADRKRKMIKRLQRFFSIRQLGRNLRWLGLSLLFTDVAANRITSLEQDLAEIRATSREREAQWMYFAEYGVWLLSEEVVKSERAKRKAEANGS